MLPFCTLISYADDDQNVCVAAWSHMFFVRGFMPRTFLFGKERYFVLTNLLFKGEKNEITYD